MLPRLPLQMLSEHPVAPRRRGLWKGRKRHTSDSHYHNHRPAKRHRSEDTSEYSDDGYYLVEFTPEPSPGCDMDSDDDHCAVEESPPEDWEDLKTSFARAAEQYENDNAAESIQLLRGVLRLCHRFLLLYQDPSLLYAEPRAKTPEPAAAVLVPMSPRTRKKCKCKESPTAFHSILGTTLFLFGNIVSQDASLVLPDEPATPVTYWLAAVDVFEMGENLPSRTSGRGCEAPEDWRMNVVWGRVLLCIADAALTQQQHPPTKTISPERKWPSPSASVFAAIQMRRPPASRRISLTTAVPHELLLLAMDLFTRAIFLMPHAAPEGASCPSKPAIPYSRAAELFTIAVETLALAERLPAAAERIRWAAWADNILGQIPAQAQTAVVARARGRCWLVYGTAHVEDLEAMGEADGWDAEVYNSEDAEDAREGLERAIGYFERDDIRMGEEEDTELRAFLAEALVTLANLTREQDKREDLYRRAQLLGCVALDEMED
ncbi:hypothetical protein MKEN_00863300 [Mycena kentingensis (nom. inval.)]|nr:hypothetical protein MKEN_00863300 [Mycena kentingensis (nom. inval.)]